MRGINRARGEVSIEIDGTLRRLCLTLGALAEIEAAFNCDTWGALQARLKKLTAVELMVVLAALLRGGGETDIAEHIDQALVSPKQAVNAVVEAFHAALV